MSILEGIGDGVSGGDLYVDSNRWYSEAAFVLITGRRFFYVHGAERKCGRLHGPAPARRVGEEPPLLDGTRVGEEYGR